MDPIDFTPDPRLTETIRGGIDAHLQKANAKDALLSAPCNATPSGSPIPVYYSGTGSVLYSGFEGMYATEADAIASTGPEPRPEPVVRMFDAPPAVDILRIPAGDRLDAIIVYFEDEAPGKGRMTIACYGDAWTAWWGGMGNRTVRQFVAAVDAGYLCGALLQLRGASDSHRAYTLRVVARVIAAVKESLRHG